MSLSKQLFEHGNNPAAFVGLSAAQIAADEGATKIYVLDQDRPKTFAAIAVTLSQLIDSSRRLHQQGRGRYFDMFTVLDAGGTDI